MTDRRSLTLLLDVDDELYRYLEKIDDRGLVADCLALSFDRLMKLGPDEMVVAGFNNESCDHLKRAYDVHAMEVAAAINNHVKNAYCHLVHDLVLDRPGNQSVEVTSVYLDYETKTIVLVLGVPL